MLSPHLKKLKFYRYYLALYFYSLQATKHAALIHGVSCLLHTPSTTNCCCCYMPLCYAIVSRGTLRVKLLSHRNCCLIAVRKHQNQVFMTFVIFYSPSFNTILSSIAVKKYWKPDLPTTTKWLTFQLQTKSYSLG